MLIDCGTCKAPADACADCVVTALLGAPAPVELQDAEYRALTVLSNAGMVPPLRLVSEAG